jgi:hypothetical protein
MKIQKPYISQMYRAAIRIRTSIKFDMFGGIAAAIKCAKFHIDRFNGLNFTSNQILHCTSVQACDNINDGDVCIFDNKLDLIPWPTR